MHPRTCGPVLSRQQLNALLNDISRGDKGAFEQLYRATSAKLYGIVLRIVRRREVADELLQDVYLRVWKHAGQFDALRSSPITWMATIARNCALDEVKRLALPLSEDDCELIVHAGEDNPADQYGEGRTLAGCRYALDDWDRRKARLSCKPIASECPARTSLNRRVSRSPRSRLGCAAVLLSLGATWRKERTTIYRPKRLRLETCVGRTRALGVRRTKLAAQVCPLGKFDARWSPRSAGYSLGPAVRRATVAATRRDRCQPSDGSIPESRGRKHALSFRVRQGLHDR